MSHELEKNTKTVSLRERVANIYALLPLYGFFWLCDHIMSLIEQNYHLNDNRIVEKNVKHHQYRIENMISMEFRFNLT